MDTLIKEAEKKMLEEIFGIGIDIFSMGGKFEIVSVQEEDGEECDYKIHIKRV